MKAEELKAIRDSRRWHQIDKDTRMEIIRIEVEEAYAREYARIRGLSKNNGHNKADCNTDGKRQLLPQP